MHGADRLGAHHIALAMASMQLRSYYFFESSASEVRKQGLIKAYGSTLSFISKLADEDAKNDFIKFVPNVFCLMLNTAGMLLMKIICSSYARYVDIEKGKRSFNIVLGLLRRASLEDNDIWGRGGKIMAQLWTFYYSRALRPEQEPNLSVKSRLGVSVLHDGLWTWREEFGGQRTAPSSSSEPVLTPMRLTLSSTPASTHQPRPRLSSKSTLASLSQNLRAKCTGIHEITPDSQEPRIAREQILLPNTPMQSINEASNPVADFSNFDWIRDVGFPSFLPIDIDSFPFGTDL